MPLREDLLNPIPGENPSGENLRYAPVYDKIKEARRQDDDAVQGEWQRERKVADYVQVVKLAGEVVATKSKDLQLAAWLTEAAIKREGFSGLLEGLKLIQGLLATFWDTLYPEIEDGDLELRATPLEWIGSKFDDLVRQAPLTKAGYGFYKYKESRGVGSEEDAQVSDERMAKRLQDIEDGKLTVEDWDKAFSATPKQYYEQTVDTLDAVLETIDALNDFCNEKFGDVAPGFGKLRSAIEEVRHLANQLLQSKGGRDSDQQAVEETAADETSQEDAVAEPSYAGSSAAAAPARAPARKVVGLEPVDREDAVSRLAAAARFLRSEDGYSPAPYLILRGLRWGELRAGGNEPDVSLLEAPPTEIRQQLKRAAVDSSWQEVLDIAETAMAMPCGRGWLDLQRYVWRAAQEMGYERIAASILSELKALLQSMPQLVEATMLDDTPTANAETQAWIKEYVVPDGTEGPRSQDQVYVPRMYEAEHAQEAAENPESPVADAFQLAMDAVRSGSKQEAIEILSHEVAQERSGRARFNRKMQLAQVCMAVGYENVAFPILEELAAEIERLQLEDWEAPDVIAQPLALLYRCLDKVDKNSDQRQRLYAKICRLDPLQALACTR